MANAPTYDGGRYWGRITRQKLGQSSTGNAQLVVSFAIIGKVNPADPEGALLPAPDGERTVYRSITAKSIDYVTEDLDKLGWYGSDYSQFDQDSDGFVSIIGSELAFFCKHEPRQDGSGLRETWSIAMTGGGAPVKPLEEKEVRKLNAMFGKALKGRQKPAAAATVPQAVEAASVPQDAAGEAAATNALLEEAAATEPADDIPF